MHRASQPCYYAQCHTFFITEFGLQFKQNRDFTDLSAKTNNKIVRSAVFNPIAGVSFDSLYCLDVFYALTIVLLHATREFAAALFPGATNAHTHLWYCTYTIRLLKIDFDASVSLRSRPP